MVIIHFIDDFLFKLFYHNKEGNNNIEELKKQISKFYTAGPYKPKLVHKDKFIEVHIEGKLIEKHEGKINEIVSLCENENYQIAKDKLSKLIDEAPNVSEYHRIMGQIRSEEGDQEEAIDYLIDALRWDPQNGWALIMMGNILAKYKRDISTAMKYYDKAIEACFPFVPESLNPNVRAHASVNAPWPN